jgi:hypothetical protein
MEETMYRDVRGTMSMSLVLPAMHSEVDTESGNQK